MISKSWCLILVFTIIFQSAICDRCYTWNNIIPDEAVEYCYQENITNTCSKQPIRNFKVHDPNEESGTVNVSFDYEPGCKFELQLTRWPEINTKENCRTHDMETDEAITHSVYRYGGTSKKQANQHNCNKTGSITLKYLYTGCYIVLLLKKPQDSEFVNNVDDKRRLYFNFTKRNLQYSENEYNKTNEQNVQTQSAKLKNKDSLTTFEYIHPFLKRLPNLNLKIETMDNNNCTKSACGCFELSPSSDVSNGSPVKYDLCNGKTKITEETGISCYVLDDKLECEFKGLDIGNYTVTYILKNLIQCPNCQYCAFERCAGRTRIDIAEILVMTPRPLTYLSEYSATFWAIVGLGCVGVLLVIVLAIFLKWKKDPKPDPVDPKNIVYKSDRHSKVLLLYPKDADIVMKTMELLRNALKTEGFEVYDVYDQNQQNIINENDTKWIINKLSDEYMKTVIIQTYCGQLLSYIDSSHSAAKLYKNPECYDGLFPYALDLIQRRVDSKNYTKLFVANMGFNKMEFTAFSFTNPSTRYSLPESYRQLIRDLHGDQECSVDICRNDKWEEFNCVYKEMKAHIEDLNYLSEILNVSISHYNDSFEIEETFKKDINV